MPIPLPFKQNLPLSVTPFYSRIQLQKDTTNIKNYYGVAFNPGYPLQASELNEMQEIFYIQQTLTQEMISSWGGNEIPSKNAEFISTWLPAKTDEIENSGWKRTSTGPGWEGCTPLNYNQIIDTTVASSVINLKLSAGWYLIKSPNINAAGGALGGGFGIWVYQPTDINAFGGSFPKNADLSSPSSLEDEDTTWRTLGLYVKSEVIKCSKTSPPIPGFDDTIQDFVNINVINGPCGASRLNLQIDNALLAAGRTPHTGGAKIDTPEGYIFVPVCKITTNGQDTPDAGTTPRLVIAQYMNGTPISIKS